MILKTPFLRESPMSGTGRKYGSVPTKNIVNSNVIRDIDCSPAVCTTNDTNGGHNVMDVMKPNPNGRR